MRWRLAAALSFMAVAVASMLLIGCSDETLTSPSNTYLPEFDDGHQTAEKGYVAPSTGTVKIAVARVQFLDLEMPQIVTDAFVEGYLYNNQGDNVKDFYSEMSYGQIALDFELFPIITLDMDYDTCPSSVHASASLDSLDLRGVQTDQYDMFLWVVPHPDGTSCSGGAGGVWYSQYQSVVCYAAGSPDVYAHEIGHGIGMDHANRDINGDGVISGSDEVYGDRSCIMGGRGQVMRLRHANAPNKWQAGWLGEGDVLRPGELVAPGENTITPLTLAPAGSAVAAIIPAADGIGSFYLSYRIDVNYDSKLVNPDPADGLDYRDGLTVHYMEDSVDPSTYTNPRFETILSDGESWMAPDGEFWIRQNSVSDSELDFEYGVPSEQTLALDPPSLPAQPFILDPQYTFELTITNTSAVTRDLDVTATGSNPLTMMVTSPVTVPASSSVTVIVTPMFNYLPSEGAYNFTVSTTDPLDPREITRTVNGSVHIDISAPTTPVLTATGDCGIASLSWTASTDGGTGLDHYAVHRDGKLILTTNDLSFEDPVGYGVTKTYVVKAVDKAGNVSASSPQTVTIPLDTTPPTRPVDLAGDAPYHIVHLYWDAANDDCAVDHYEIKRNTSIVGTSTSPVYYSTCSPYTTYTFYVRAVDPSGNKSAWSAPCRVTTGPIINFGT